MISAKQGFWIGAGAIALAALAAYSGSLGGAFVFDDTASILANPTIRHVAGAWTTPHGHGWTVEGRPVLNLSLAVNYAISGTAVWTYHVFNLLVHICAGLTLYGIIRRSLDSANRGGALWFAFGVALLWTVHPLQTEAVTYVIQRAESLMGLFYLLALYCFIRGSAGADSPVAPRPRRPTLWLILSALCCFLAVGTKEVAVTLPVMVLMYDRCFVAGGFRAAWKARGRYYLGLAATWLFLAALLAGGGGNRSGSKGFGIGVSWWDWELTQFQAIAHYLRLAVWPRPLILSYGPFWIGAREAAPYVPIVAVLAVATCWALAGPAGGARRRAGFLGFWFFGILAVTSIVPGNADMIAEQRMYLPLAAVLAAIVAALAGAARRIGKRPRPAAALAFCLVWGSALGALTWRRNADYRDELTIWSDAAAKRPSNPYAQYMVGVAYSNLGRPAEEIARYREALRLKPDLFEAEHSLGNALLHQRDVAGALRELRLALAGEPENAELHYDYGVALFAEGASDEAMEQYRRALALNPDYAQAHDNLGTALARLGRMPEALAEFKEAARIDPREPLVRANWGAALASQGRLDEAQAQYEEALRLDAGFSAAHFYLGNVLCQQGRFAEAIPHYEHALRPTGDNPAVHYSLADAHHNLGVALSQVGRDEEAARELELAAQMGAR